MFACVEYIGIHSQIVSSIKGFLKRWGIKNTYATGDEGYKGVMWMRLDFPSTKITRVMAEYSSPLSSPSFRIPNADFLPWGFKELWILSNINSQNPPNQTLP